MSAATDPYLGQLCRDAALNYYCVIQHLESIEGERLDLMNKTIQEIGDIVSSKCQGMHF